MKKYLSLILGTLLMLFITTNLQAESLYNKFIQMEYELKQLKGELKALKDQNEELQSKLSSKEEESDNEGDEEADDEENSDKSVTSNDKENDNEEADDEDEEGDDEEGSVEERLSDLEESVQELNKNTSTNNLKFNVDFRTAVDNINYKMADGKKLKNDALLTNRLWLNMSWKATDILSFRGQLAYNKAYGYRSAQYIQPLENFDWIVNTNPYDGNIRVKNAFFLLKDNQLFGSKISYTFSIGRRPSTNGLLINLRDDDPSASPIGHSINVEFDGASAKLGFEEWIPGMYVKFCLGRGLTNASAKFFSLNPSTNTIASNPPYINDKKALPNIDLAGFIFVPYNDGQYALHTQYYYAKNLIDADLNQTMTATYFKGFKTVGDMQSLTVTLTVDGIGDGWSDYLDDTYFFASYAMSKTSPNKSGGGMLGSLDSKTGYSYWVGLSMPSLFSEDGKWGIEYNHGSQYWRSITYGEDTLIGSKVATRGDAYEVYFTEPLIDDIFSMQIRYTYIDYKYTGSNGFFGSTTGAAMEIAKLPSNYKPFYVDKAQDIRFYLRYRY